MVLLGEEAASHIYRNLPEGDVQRLTRRIAELEHFKPETRDCRARRVSPAHLLPRVIWPKVVRNMPRNCW